MKKQLLLIALAIVGIVAINNLNAYEDETQEVTSTSNGRKSSRQERRDRRRDTNYNNGPLGTIIGAPVAFAGDVVEGTGRVVEGTGRVVEDTGDAISGRNQ